MKRNILFMFSFRCTAKRYGKVIRQLTHNSKIFIICALGEKEELLKTPHHLLTQYFS